MMRRSPETCSPTRKPAALPPISYLTLAERAILEQSATLPVPRSRRTHRCNALRKVRSAFGEAWFEVAWESYKVIVEFVKNFAESARRILEKPLNKELIKQHCQRFFLRNYQCSIVNYLVVHHTRSSPTTYSATLSAEAIPDLLADNAFRHLWYKTHDYGTLVPEIMAVWHVGGRRYILGNAARHGALGCIFILRQSTSGTQLRRCWLIYEQPLVGASQLIVPQFTDSDQEVGITGIDRLCASALHRRSRRGVNYGAFIKRIRAAHKNCQGYLDFITKIDQLVLGLSSSLSKSVR